MTTLPLILAFAISISKSQGLTIKIIPLTWKKNGSIFQKRLGVFGTQFLYVALSRTDKIDNINLATIIGREHIKVCEDSIAFWKKCILGKHGATGYLTCDVTLTHHGNPVLIVKRHCG